MSGEHDASWRVHDGADGTDENEEYDDVQNDEPMASLHHHLLQKTSMRWHRSRCKHIPSELSSIRMQRWR